MSYYDCIQCGEEIHPARFNLGYCTCLTCGEAQARTARLAWTVAPMHKSNYVLVTDRELLKQFNPKRTQA